jgi:hypothetical protein
VKTTSFAAVFLALAAAQPGLPEGPNAAASGLSCCEAPARWAARHDSEDARIAITTEDGDVTLLLTRRVVALQLSDRTFHKVNRELRRKKQEEEDNPIAEALKTAVIGSVRALLDHSAECPVRELSDVAYRGGRLIFTTEDGDRIFEDVEVHDSDVMGDFSERDAREFVREFRRLKARMD